MYAVAYVTNDWYTYKSILGIEYFISFIYQITIIDGKVNEIVS